MHSYHAFDVFPPLRNFLVLSTAVFDETGEGSNALGDCNTNNEPEETEHSNIDIDVPFLDMEQRHTESTLNVNQEQVVATMVTKRIQKPEKQFQKRNQQVYRNQKWKSTQSSRFKTQ